MLTSDTKSKINKCRDILVGKIPDPKGQIDQITNALIYKFMDDQDQESIGMSGNPSHFVGELAPYAWNKLLDPKLDNQEKADKYREGLEKLSSATSLPDFFRDVFKNTYLPFRDASTIVMFIKEINGFEYRNEELGNAFEYLLSIMGSQGDAGQFRTPRNIIEFVVQAVNPSKSDTILDPACGTAGFLVRSFEHIVANQTLSQLDRNQLAKNIVGVDIDPGMAKIARVNLYLHGFSSPHITEDDTLTNEHLWSNTKYDVILANPPFMTPKGGIEPHKKFSITSNRAEVLFVDYIAEHLKLEGRAGIIVPEGVIFQSGKAYKQLRKKLVDDGFLYAVVSLPAGVFQPYSGVKTSVLLLDRRIAKEKDDILFIKVENDGFDLGAQRRETKDKNDLPKALEILQQYRSGELASPSSLSNQTNLPNSLQVPKSKIAESGDYNLSGDRYKIATDYSNAVWPMVELGELEKEQKITFLRGQGLSKKDLVENGAYECIHYGEIYTIYEPIIKQIVSKTEFDGKIKSIKGDVLVPSTTTADAMGIAVARSLNTDNVIIGGDINVIRTENKFVLANYLAWLISTPPLKLDLANFAKGVNILHLSNSDLRQLKIPLPPLHIQQKIVDEIEIYQNIIAGARQVIENAKRERGLFGSSPEWRDYPRVKLGEVAIFKQGKQVDKNIHSSEPKEGYVRFIRIIDYTQDNADIRYVPLPKGDVFCYENELIMVRYGKPGLVGRGIKGVFANNLFKIDFQNNKDVDLNFAFYILNSDLVQDYLKNNLLVVGLPAINHKTAKDIQIPLPPLPIQEAIVAKIEAEKVLIDGNKKLIEIYEAKVKEVIGRVWEG